MSRFIENWRCIESGFEQGSLNMAIDEMLLSACIRDEIGYPILRFFGFRPGCVTFGISQRFSESETLKGLESMGKEIVRRPTGGGIVVHDYDLCYSLITPVRLHPDFSSTEISYEAIHQAVYAGFRHEGIDVTFAESGKQSELADAVCSKDVVKCDLLYKEHKIAGGAQRRRDGYFLHQGFISLKPFVTSRMEYFVWFERMRRAVQEGFKDRFGSQLNVGGLFLEEADEALKLKSVKYDTAEWNRNAFSAFSVEALAAKSEPAKLGDQK